ncbi:uncharacterized protein F5147DRAFT_649295 [Suillus discolor]|uniref:Uncharacterized protein n=1 Tax=Suillus discolor TaxID=1912936 RepID=A0A9P7FEC3_9AGAM|nr:uncharacterized protein F5147DRAFT_649295 [Suillus discolor]KAG2115866.1 hypothetical protein F5147DRAFT_649295 [Suillus discolor]
MTAECAWKKKGSTQEHDFLLCTLLEWHHSNIHVRQKVKVDSTALATTRTKLAWRGAANMRRARSTKEWTLSIMQRYSIQFSSIGKLQDSPKSAKNGVIRRNTYKLRGNSGIRSQTTLRGLTCLVNVTLVRVRLGRTATRDSAGLVTTDNPSTPVHARPARMESKLCRAEASVFPNSQPVLLDSVCKCGFKEEKYHKFGGALIGLTVEATMFQITGHARPRPLGSSYGPRARVLCSLEMSHENQWSDERNSSPGRRRTDEFAVLLTIILNLIIPSRGTSEPVSVLKFSGHPHEGCRRARTQTFGAVKNAGSFIATPEVWLWMFNISQHFPRLPHRIGMTYRPPSTG